MERALAILKRAGLWLKQAGIWLAGHGVEARLAVRVATAGVGAYLLAELLGLQQGYWAVFTAVIVMQASVGGSVKATLDRLTGTLGGAIVGGAAAMIAINGGTTTIAIALAAALLPLGFLAAVDARFRIAPVTAAIVLVSPFGQAATPIWFTIDRILEIGLGSVVALAVALLILPARAHVLLSDAATKLLDLMAEFLGVILAGASTPHDGAAIRRLQVSTRRTLVALESAADEARRERSVHLTDAPDPEPVARTALHIRNDLIILARATVEPLPAPFADRLGPPLSAIATEAGAYLRGLGQAFATRGEPPSPEAFDAALRAYRAEVATLREEGATRGIDAAVLGRIFALGFGLEQFRQNAGDLAARAAEFSQTKAPAAST